MDHAVDMSKNGSVHRIRKLSLNNQYGNDEEKRVIQGNEAKTAKCNGESVRYNHKGTPYKVKSSTSTEPYPEEYNKD